MRPTQPIQAIKAALVTATVLTAGLTASPAAAQSFKLDKIEINGVTSVPVQPLRDALKEHPGDTVTTDNVLADQDNLEKALESAHVTGGVKTSLRNKANGHKDIIFAVTDTGVAKPVVTTTALHVAHVAFTGNQYMSADDLAAAAQLKPGDVVTDQVLADATAKVAAAYKKASDSKAQQAGKTNVAAQVAYPQPGQVDVTWAFTQTAAAKKKKRNTDDEGFKTDAN
jgi:outer membrane protein assembly factor BamA